MVGAKGKLFGIQLNGTLLVVGEGGRELQHGMKFRKGWLSLLSRRYSGRLAQATCRKEDCS